MKTIIKIFPLISILTFLLLITAGACNQPPSARVTTPGGDYVHKALEAAKTYVDSGSANDLDNVIATYQQLENIDGGIKALAEYKDDGHSGYATILAARAHAKLKDIFLSFLAVATSQQAPSMDILLDATTEDADNSSAQVVLLSTVVSLDPIKNARLIKKSGTFSPKLALSIISSLADNAQVQAINGLDDADKNNYLDQSAKTKNLSAAVRALLSAPDIAYYDTQVTFYNTTLSDTINNVSYEIKPMPGNYFVMRYKLNGNVITRDEFIGLLIANSTDGKDFRLLFNRSIADLPNPSGGNHGYMTWAPVINGASAGDDFYYIAQEKALFNSGLATLYGQYLGHCDAGIVGAIPNLNFNNRFFKFFYNNPLNNFAENGPANAFGVDDFGAAVFKGGAGAANPAEIMVTPCPINPNITNNANLPLLHIYSFAKYLKANIVNTNTKKRLHSFWYAVGKTARQMFDGTNVTDIDGVAQSKLYLNTHGNIRYLHYRVESDNPLHYGHAPAGLSNILRDEIQSRTFYQAIGW